jgi:F0F1-type ATP synthase assembly protein I
MNKTSGLNSKPVSGENLDASDADRIEAQANTNAVSRAIAVMILMVIPGVAGSYLDKWMGTQFFVVIGFVLGIGIAILGLLYVARIADLAAKKSRELRKSTDGGKSASSGHE